MTHGSKLSIFVAGIIICITAAPAYPGGGTTIVAEKGQPAFIADAWAEGVAELVNDPARTIGWNPWFAEWPSDVRHYAFDITRIDDVNRLIRKLSAAKSPVRQVRLSWRSEPRSLGWVTSVPEGNRIAVVFTIGDQLLIDLWYKRVKKPFGKIEFLAAPVAVHPTLTIFVQNDLIDLQEITIPDGVAVSAGYVPNMFHRWNTRSEKERETKGANAPKRQMPKLDAGVQRAADEIIALIKQRDQRQKEIVRPER